MCGIVGILARGAPVSPEILERATRSLAHRGPDDSGTIILQQAAPEPVEIGLGNRRLAILDLSLSGHQPMEDPASGNWIVFNGEIYNFRELRKELEKEGLNFRGNSDTEVLLKAYGRWGEGCMDHLRGMFAFAIWDARQKRLFIGRDPMGIKPVYYHSSEKYFLFASELRTLLATGLVPRRLDDAGLANYLEFGSVYDPNTLVEGIHSLLPGHCLSWGSGYVQVRKYWDVVGDPGTIAQRDGNSVHEISTQVHSFLLDSVRLHTVSDVPIGVFLSGGIDSSSLVALLTEIGIRPNTFSLVFRESKFNEAEYSRQIAHQFGTEHQEIRISPRDALEAIPGALRAMDQPTVDGVNTYLISRQVRAAGLKVALSGLGGDEIFGGYSSFRSVPRMEIFGKPWRYAPALMRSGVAAAVEFFRSTDQSRKIAILVRTPAQVLHPCFLGRALCTRDQVQKLFPSADVQTEKRADAPLHAMLDQARKLDPINRVSYLESHGYLANTLLRDSDFMSMAHGLELRVPFVHAPLASYLQSLPGPWKMHPRIPKPLLVSALQCKLPDSIIFRRKRGFTLPFDHWLREEMRNEVEQSLTKPSSSMDAILNGAAVRKVWDQFLTRKTSWSRPWSLYVLRRWCDSHLS